MTSNERLRQLFRDFLCLPEENLQFIHPDDMLQKLTPLRLSSAIKIRNIGLSKESRPIYSIDIGSGKRHLAAIAGAHADEPVGTLTLLELAKMLSGKHGQKLTADWTFHLIPQINPDGVIHNWGWMKRDFSFMNLARYSYRNNDPAEDIEHGISIVKEQEQRPEVKAFLSYFDSMPKIDYYLTLHTTHVSAGAIYAILCKERSFEKKLVSKIGRKCKQLKLPLWDLDPLGRRGIKQITPGFLTPPSVDDYLRAFDGQNEVLKKIRMTTYQYVHDTKGAVASIITELPSIVIPEMSESEKTCISRYDLEKENIRRTVRILEKLKQEWNKLEHFPTTAENAKWLKYYNVLFDLEFEKIKESQKDLNRFQGKFARASEVHELSLDKDESEYKLALMGIRRLEGVHGHVAEGLNKDYESAFYDAFFAYESRRNYWIVPRKMQIRLQLEAILAGPLLLD